MILNRTGKIKLFNWNLYFTLLLFIGMSVQMSAQTYLINGKVVANNGKQKMRLNNFVLSVLFKIILVLHLSTIAIRHCL